MAAAVGAAISLAGARAHAGLTMVFQRGQHAPSTMWIEGANMRVDSNEASAQATGILFDGAGKRMVILNDTDKSYMVITSEDMKRMKDSMKAMRAQAQARLKDMPPEQRKRMEAMLDQMGGGDQKPREYKFEKMGAKKTINGFGCEMYRLKIDGKVHEEDCVAPWGPAAVQKSDFDALKPFFEQMSKDFSGAAGNGGDRDLLERINKAPGFPISRVPIEENGTRGEEEQLKSLKRGAIAGDKFAIPSGFTKKTLPQMGAPAPGTPGGPPKGGPFRPLPPQQ